MTVAARSSGRTSLSEPLKARPNGERAVETMTASGMGPPVDGLRQVSDCLCAIVGRTARKGQGPPYGVRLVSYLHGHDGTAARGGGRFGTWSPPCLGW